MNKLLKTAILASIKAGLEILKVYETDFNVEYKEDESPLTLADKNANEIIMSYLDNTGIDVLSEEGRNIDYEERKQWKELWIVDPLDGTKEFVKRNGEFTVNIALVKDQQPIMGVVYTPVQDVLFYGDKELGAFKLENASLLPDNFDKVLSTAMKIPQAKTKSTYNIVASRSHLTQETKDFIDKLKKDSPDIAFVDIKMPKLNGIEAIRQSKKISPHTQYYILTCYPVFDYAQQAIDIGISGYLLKPVSTNELNSIIKKYI